MPASEDESMSPSSPTTSCVSEDTDGRVQQTETRKPPLKNASRERRKAEKLFLTKHIVDLELELSRLLAERAVARCIAPSRVWRSLARRQLGRLMQSQDENQRLKARLLHQLEVAKTLEHVLRNRAGAFDENEASSDGLKVTYPVNDLAALHEQCMDKIDQLYMQVDEVFDAESRSKSFGERPLHRSRAFVQPDSGHEKLCVDTAYAPFPFARVCRATWRAITTEFSRQNRVIQQYRCTDDEYTSKFWMPHVAPMRENEERFSATMTMHKFNEETRMVLVWHGLDIKETAQGSGVYSSESGWLVAERAEDPVTGQPSEDGTVVRIYTRYTPVSDGRTDPRQSIAQFARGQIMETDTQPPHRPVDSAHFLLKGTEADIASMTEAIENILLDEAIGSSDEDLEAMVDFGALLPDHSLNC